MAYEQAQHDSEVAYLELCDAEATKNLEIIKLAIHKLKIAMKLLDTY